MPRPLRPDDLHDLHSVSDVVLHPDGARLVYELSWPDRETDRNRSVLWLHGPDEHRPLTTAHRARRPSFSPDGRWLALLVSTEPDSPTQLGVLPVGGGELRVLTDRPDGVADVAWCPGSDRVVIQSPTRPADQEGVDDDELARRPRVITEQAARFNGRGWVHDRRHQLYVVTVGDGTEPPTCRQLTTMPRDATTPSVSTDGRVAFTSAGGADADLTGVVDLWIVPVDGAAEPQRVTDGAGTWVDAHWLLDGRLLARGAPEVGVHFSRPFLLDPEASRAPEPLGDLDVNVVALLGGAIRPIVQPDAVVLPAHRRGAVHLDRYPLDGGPVERLVDGHRSVTCAAATPSGARLVVGITTGRRPSALFEQGPDGQESPLTDHDRALLDELDLAVVEEVEARSADGSMVHGFVVTPPPSAPAADGPGPGLVYVHGGPLSQYGWSFFDEFQIAAAAGYVVIGGNPRGSDGYGEAWARALIGDMGGPDWDDVQALTDALAARADVDPDRIGIGGGSYGGFMAAWAIGHTDRYRAALVERAVTNWETMTTTSDIGGWFVEPYTGGDIDTDREALRRQSPVTHAFSVTTPTLILHSEEDWRCPIEQAEQLFGIMRRQSVEVTLLRFPGEDHELSRSGLPSHRIERFVHIHDFFARHLGGAPVNGRDT